LKLPTGKTPRQELISHAVIIMRRYNCRPCDAIEAALDGAKPKTIGGAMLNYWLSLSERVQARIEGEIGRLR
jgi:hypothetical protein